MLLRLCELVLCLRGGRESVDGAEGCRPLIWEVRRNFVCFTRYSPARVHFVHVEDDGMSLCVHTARARRRPWSRLTSSERLGQMKTWRTRPSGINILTLIVIKYITIHSGYLGLFVGLNCNACVCVCVRFGIGRFTTEAEVDYTAEKCITQVSRLREMR